MVYLNFFFQTFPKDVVVGVFRPNSELVRSPKAFGLHYADRKRLETQVHDILSQKLFLLGLTQAIQLRLYE